MHTRAHPPRRIAPELRTDADRRRYVERLGHVGRCVLDARENVETLLGGVLLAELEITRAR